MKREQYCGRVLLYSSLAKNMKDYEFISIVRNIFMNSLYNVLNIAVRRPFLNKEVTK